MMGQASFQKIRLAYQDALALPLWQEKARQLDSLYGVVSLSRSGGNQEKVVRSIIQWTLEQIYGLELATVFAVLSDEPKGSMTLTTAVPDAAEGLIRQLTAGHAERLKKLLDQWGDFNPRTLPPKTRWPNWPRNCWIPRMSL
jgi:hypothetical protein